MSISNFINNSCHVDHIQNSYLVMWHKFCWVELKGPGLFYVIVYKITKDPDDEKKSIRTIIASYPLLIQKDKIVPVLNVERLDIHRWFKISNPALLPTGNIDTYVHYLGPIPTGQPTPTGCQPIVVAPIHMDPPDFSGARTYDYLPGELFANFAMKFTATGQIQINFRNARGRLKFFASVQDQWRSAFEEVGTGWIRIDPIIKPEEFKNTDQKVYILQAVDNEIMIWVNGRLSLKKEYMYMAPFLSEGNITMEQGQIDFPMQIKEYPDHFENESLPRNLPLIVNMVDKTDVEAKMGHDQVGTILTTPEGTWIKSIDGAKYLAGLRSVPYNNIYPETKELWGNRSTEFIVRMCGNVFVWGERTKDNENGLLISFLGDAWGPAGFYQMKGPPGREPTREILHQINPLPKKQDLLINLMAVDDVLTMYVNTKLWDNVDGIDLGSGAISIANGGNGVLETDYALMKGMLTIKQL